MDFPQSTKVQYERVGDDDKDVSLENGGANTFYEK